MDKNTKEYIKFKKEMNYQYRSSIMFNDYFEKDIKNEEIFNKQKISNKIDIINKKKIKIDKFQFMNSMLYDI